jgi:enoyl-CoA hydratase/carnithine racemase
MTNPAGEALVENEIDAGILALTFNRPEKKNALTREMYHCLTEILRTADRDDSVRVVLIRGAGDCFCGGNDIEEFRDDRDPDVKSPGMMFLEAISRFEKPVIAAVKGAAVGIGTTMLLHCDLVYASSNATFQVPFVNLGLCPEGGSSFLLPRMVGHQRASEMLLLGEPISALTAKAFGLVNRVYGNDEMMEEVLRHARRLAAQPLDSLLLTKHLLKQSHRELIQKTIGVEGRHFAERLGSVEFKQAAAAFLSRRRSNAG